MENENHEDNQQQLIDIDRKLRLNILKHTFFLIIIVEVVVIVAQLFTLSFYKLYTPDKNEQNQIWISFFYSCENHDCFNNNEICAHLDPTKNYYNSYCKSQSKVSSINIVRYSLSGILIFIIFFITFDIYRTNNIKNQLKQRILDPRLVYKAKKYQLLLTLLLTVYYVVLLLFLRLADGADQSKLGTSFYVGMCGTIFYVIIIIYYRYIKGRFTRARMFEALLQQELLESQLICQEIEQFKIKKNSQDSFQSIQ